MRAVVQRVSEAAVTVEGEVVGRIGAGLLVLLGIHQEDSERQADRMAEKLLALRVFQDGEGRMNRSVVDTGGRRRGVRRSYECLACQRRSGYAGRRGLAREFR